MHDDRRQGLHCPYHPEQRAVRLFTVQFGRSLRKRFSDYPSAERFLDGLRYEVDRGSFDSRDYCSGNPLSFTALSNRWLLKKQGKVKPRTHSLLMNYIKTAQQFFGDMNVKSIHYSHLEDFLDSLTCSDKTKSNYLSCLHSFYTWLVKSREINLAQMPEFPAVRYELAYRKTVSKETQQAVLDRLKEISFHVSPKIWLGIKWLSTYISIRPEELRSLKEEHIDLDQGVILIPHPKEKRPKLVPLLPEDIQQLLDIPKGLSEQYFFRHSAGVSGVAADKPFGLKLFYKWWKRACADLGIEGVDLYGGTRHSSVVDLRHYATPEQIKHATMHTTNAAFERYYQVSRDELERLYSFARCDTAVMPKNSRSNQTII